MSEIGVLSEFLGGRISTIRRGGPAQSRRSRIVRRLLASAEQHKEEEKRK